MTDSRLPSDELSELDRGARLRVRLGGLLAVAASAIALVLAGPGLRQPLYDVFQRVSPVSMDGTRVEVVLIDAPSLAAVGGWPWSRYALARLTEQIAARGAVAIGFDFLFPEPDRQSPQLFADFYPELSVGAANEIRALPSMDAVFARVIGRSPVVLARAGVSDRSFDSGGGGAASLPPTVAFRGATTARLPNYPQVVDNLRLLDERALGIGLVNGPPDPDGVVRRAPLLARAKGELTPGFALELARAAEGLDDIELVGDQHLRAVKIGQRRLPVDGQGRLALRFGDLPGTAMISAADLLRSGVRANAFDGKVVIVGLTAAGTSDVVTTPRATETYGVFVQAQAVDAILRGLALHRPPWATTVEMTAATLLALAALAFAPRLRLRAILALAAAVCGVTLALSWAAFLNGWLTDPFVPLVPALAAVAAMIGVLFVEGGKVRARLRADIERQRLAAAKVAAELGVASDIQSGMLITRAQLNAIHPAVEVDAVLQSALTVGGDLYDAFALDDGRLCFLAGDVTGKGVPAALFMALTKALARSNFTRPGVRLDRAMNAISAELSRDNAQSMAVSMLVCVLDPSDGSLEICCAGHENPLVMGETGGARELVLDGGPPLCVVDDFPYPVERRRLQAGETFVIFTDGASEAQNPAGALFGRESVARALSLVSPGLPLTRTTDSLVAAVRAFENGGSPSDDLTVMAVRLR